MDCTIESSPLIAASGLDFSIPWTYAECARFLRIEEITLRDWVKAGNGPPRIKLSRTRQGMVLFWPASVQAWLLEREQGKPPTPVPVTPTGRRGRPPKMAVEV